MNTSNSRQSKIPVLRTPRQRGKLNSSPKSLAVSQKSLESEKENSARTPSDIFNLEELLCDIQDSIEKKQPNFMEDMKDIISAKDRLYEELNQMKAEKIILGENWKNDRMKLVQENSLLHEKCKESQNIVDEITLNLEMETSKTKDLESKLSETEGETELLKESRRLKPEYINSLLYIQAKLEDTEYGLEELARENQSLQYELEQLSGLSWVEDQTVSSCQDCQAKFTVRLRKHHCRKCGRIFCRVCSAKGRFHSRKNITSTFTVY